MIPAVSLIVVVSLSLLVTRIATVALVHTGLSIDSARFQARSAFTGTGFTTSEAEGIVGHPVRRRIVMWLMLVGNVGIVTAIASLMLSLFDMKADTGVPPELLVIAVGLLLLTIAARSRWLERHLARVISWALARWTRIDARDFARLLHLREDYGVCELPIREGDWLADKTLRDSRLGNEGVLVLGVECPGSNFIGAPGAETVLRPGDRLTLYGASRRIEELAHRGPGAGGDRAHVEARSEAVMREKQQRERAGR